MTDPTLHITDDFKRTVIRLSSEHPMAWTGMYSGILYLTEFRSNAQRPDVAWHLKQSTFGESSGEVRWPPPEIQSDTPSSAWRALFVAAADCSWFVFAVLGNKAVHPGGSAAWYDEHIPVLDKAVDEALARFSLHPLPKK